MDFSLNLEKKIGNPYHNWTYVSNLLDLGIL